MPSIAAVSIMFAAAGRARSAGRITMDDMEKAERSSDKLAKANDEWYYGRFSKPKIQTSKAKQKDTVEFELQCFSPIPSPAC